MSIQHTKQHSPTKMRSSANVPPSFSELMSHSTPPASASAEMLQSETLHSSGMTEAEAGKKETRRVIGPASVMRYVTIEKHERVCPVNSLLSPQLTKITCDDERRSAVERFQRQRFRPQPKKKITKKKT